MEHVKRPTGWRSSELTMMARELDGMLAAGWRIDPESRAPEVIAAWKSLAVHAQRREAEQAAQAERDAKQAAWDRRVKERRNGR